MLIKRNLFFIFFIVLNLNASMQKDIVYVENLDSQEKSLKDEFFNENTELYTLSIGTLTLQRHDPIDFFRTYGMKNAVAYKFGEKKEFARVISGVYKSGTEATNDIKNLDPRLQRNKPYSAKLIRHQRLFKENNGLTDKITKKSNTNIPNKNIEKKATKTKLKKSQNSIYTSENEESKNLKKEFLNKKSKYYSIALGSISLDKSSIQNFFETYGVSDKALAHIYGKNRDKARIIYGLYKTPEEAREAVSKLNSRLKANSPFASKMKRFQKFYKKYYPNGMDDEMIIELKVNDKKSQEKVSSVKLSDEIKIVKKIDKPKTKSIKEKVLKPKIEAKVIKEKPKKVVKKTIPKKINKENPNKRRFVKYSKLEDVYFIESDGNFNILNEVFLNEGSSFYTVDLGELKLNEISIEQFFLKNSMEDHALVYKYGDNKEFARTIYGAYESKEDAKKAIETLNVDVKKDKIRVSNIKNHQKLYKEYHKSAFKTKKIARENVISYDNKANSEDDILFVENGEKNILKDEFFSRASSLYTITIITFLKENMSVDRFLSNHNLIHNTVAYSIGSANNYYRIIHGVYSSSNEAKEAISSLSFDLRKNRPFVSKISTNQKKFESYNNRVLEDEIKRSKEIQF